MWAHSPKDIWVVLGSLLNLTALLTAWALYDVLPAWALLPFAVLIAFLCCTNIQCLAHQHIHNPLFKSQALNHLFSIVETFAIGAPFTLYKFQHLNHHAYTSDSVDPATGTTKDMTSIYRHARANGNPEHVLSYAILSPFRNDTKALYGMARKNGLVPQVWVEVTALLGFLLVLGSLKPQFLIFYVPLWCLCHMSAYWVNHTEHFAAVPGNRLTDSVSCYGAFYNLIWLNNGYHQEHHYRPQMHWTKVRALRASMLPESERHVVKYVHWLNFSMRAAVPAPKRATPPSDVAPSSDAVPG